eukprot:m.37677 g.37677  ORF g.37677 m.37677 type:complete len:109 (+) comp11410_c1_seq1:1312-1638(+)
MVLIVGSRIARAALLLLRQPINIYCFSCRQTSLQSMKDLPQESIWRQLLIRLFSTATKPNQLYDQFTHGIALETRRTPQGLAQLATYMMVSQNDQTNTPVAPAFALDG